MAKEKQNETDGNAPGQEEAPVAKAKKAKTNVFPTWRYHRVKGKRIFNTPAELAAAGPGWSETPFGYDVANGEGE